MLYVYLGVGSMLIFWIIKLGRFVTWDVILSTNQYVHARNNSVNFIDPNGMLEVVDASGDIVQLPIRNV